MNKTAIEWCDMTWNPVTGCLNNCDYCYARKIAHRFAERTTDGKITEYGELHEVSGADVPLLYPFGFDPTMRWDRLEQPQKYKEGKTIFVCSMADLFGDWIPDTWLFEVIRACKQAPQHQYIFLSKYPANYRKLDMILFEGVDNFIFKKDKLYQHNMWAGSTITGQNDKGIATSLGMCNAFLNIEPLLGRVYLPEKHNLKWVIIGAETGNKKEKVTPKLEWIADILKWARRKKVPVFMKDSLIPIIGEENMIRELPFYKD